MKPNRSSGRCQSIRLYTPTLFSEEVKPSNQPPQVKTPVWVQQGYKQAKVLPKLLYLAKLNYFSLPLQTGKKKLSVCFILLHKMMDQQITTQLTIFVLELNMTCQVTKP